MYVIGIDCTKYAFLNQLNPAIYVYFNVNAHTQTQTHTHAETVCCAVAYAHSSFFTNKDIIFI